MTSHDSIKTCEHHSSVKFLIVSGEDSFVSDVSHGSSEGEIKISAVNNLSTGIMCDNRGAES